MHAILRHEKPGKPTLLACACVAVALAVRLLQVLFTTRYNPLATSLQLDAATYDRWARALAIGGDPGPTTLMQAPLYPWFLSLIYRVFGPNLTAVRLTQAFLGAATCGLIIYSTRRFFKSWPAALIAGAMAALYTPFIFYEGILVPAALIIFLNALFIAFLSREGGSLGSARLFAAGLIMGLSFIANPVTIIIVPFVVIHLIVSFRFADEPEAGESPREWPRPLSALLRRALALAAGIVLALAPVTIRNAVRTGEFVPLTTGGGINFYIGNNPEANGFYAVPSFHGAPLGGTPEEQWRNMQIIASQASGRTLSQSEASRFWFGAGLDFIRREPRRWAALLWNKFLFFWNAYERANVENFYFHRRFAGILRLRLVTYGIVAPLGLLGIFLTRRRWKRLWLLYGGVLTYLSAALVFYVLARYRLPVVLFLVPFAGAAVVELVDIGRNRRIAELVVVLAAGAVLVFISNRQMARDTPFGISTNFTRLGDAYIARGDTASALDAYREALRLNPQNAGAKEAVSKLGAR